jgi:hypothetical protein
MVCYGAYILPRNTPNNSRSPHNSRHEPSAMRQHCILQLRICLCRTLFCWHSCRASTVHCSCTVPPNSPNNACFCPTHHLLYSLPSIMSFFPEEQWHWLSAPRTAAVLLPHSPNVTPTCVSLAVQPAQYYVLLSVGREHCALQRWLRSWADHCLQHCWQRRGALELRVKHGWVRLGNIACSSRAAATVPAGLFGAETHH